MLLTVHEFANLAMTSMPSLVRSLQEQTGRFGDEEARAWRASLGKLAVVLDDAELGEFHIHLSAKSGNLSLEYRLPAASSWCDVVLLGHGASGPSAVILELKNWQTSGDRPGPREGLVLHRGAPTLHPSDQVRGYVEYCRHFHSAVQAMGANVSGCVLFTDAEDVAAYRRAPHAELSTAYPVFGSSAVDAGSHFSAFVRDRLHRPDPEFATAFEKGQYSQDRDFVRCVADALLADTGTKFVLLDGQRLGFERCLAAVEEVCAAGDGGKTTILIEGPPGSGKSVLAARLWATLAKDDRLDGDVVLVTTSGSQKSNWKSLYEGLAGDHAAHGVVVPANQFNPGLSPVWVKEQRKLGRSMTIGEWTDNLKVFGRLKGPARIRDNQFAVSVVDEAHALIDPTAPGAEGISPSGWSHHAGPQAWHIIRASRISIFLLDSQQSYRDNETTTRENLRRFAEAQGARMLEPISLAGAQFRCAGSVDYIEWVDRFLAGDPQADASFARESPGDTGSFALRLVDDPEELELRLREHVDAGRTARMLAPYARPWVTKKVARPHELPVDRMDFRIPYRRDGQDRVWARIWNFAPDENYTLFVQAPEGSRMHDDPLSEVGCPYVVRGFDWDYIGLLWLSDLVWRKDRWVPQLGHVHETAWRKSLAAAKKEAKAGHPGTATDEVRANLARGYRILLTRAIRGAYVWCEDAETRAHLADALMR